MKKAIFIIVMLVFTSCSTKSIEGNKDFNNWVEQLKLEAIENGISKKIVKKAFKDVNYNEKIVSLDRSQPEKKKTFEQYLEQVVNSRRIKQGQSFS